MYLCLDKCPDSAPFYSQETQECTPACTSNKVTLDSNNNYICTESCNIYQKEISVKNFIINKCVDKCDENEYLLDGQCLQSCNQYQQINDEYRVCVEKCDGFIFKNKDKEICVRQCPSNASFITKNESEHLICTSSCQTGFQMQRYVFPDRPEIYAMQCVNECQTFVNDTKLCDRGYAGFKYINVSVNNLENLIEYSNVEVCEHYIYMDRFCIPTCTGYVLYKDELKYCNDIPNTGYYIQINNEKVILQNCSEVSEYNYHYIVDGFIECTVEKCSKHSEEGLCTESCKDQGKVYDEQQQLCISRQQCTKQINVTQYESYCQDCEYQNCQKCSINAYTIVDDIKRCVKMDQVFLPINNGTEYILQCPNNSIFYNQKNQQCVSDCNLTYQYLNQYLCIDQCDTKMYEPNVIENQKTFICSSKCKNENLFAVVDSQIICQPECDMMYFDYDSLECVASCDQFYNEQQRKCVSQCNKYFYLNDYTNHRQCTLACPSNYINDNQTNECVLKTLNKASEKTSFVTIVSLTIGQIILILIIILVSVRMVRMYKMRRRQQKQVSLPQILNVMMKQQKSPLKKTKELNKLLPKSIFDAKNHVPVIICDEEREYTPESKGSRSDISDWTKHVQQLSPAKQEEKSQDLPDTKERKVSLQQLFD